MKRATPWWYSLIVLCCAIVLTVLLAEVVLRVAFPSEQDPRGWSRSEPGQWQNTVENTPGEYRTFNVTYVQHGFQRWPTNTSGKTRVLILGDSFTEMVYVPRGGEWYASLERAFPQSAFYVYGVGGYGTTQQYLALEEYYDEIQPDVILWQFYFNDFTNNYFSADLHEYPLNNLARRPYFEDGELVYRYPMRWSRLRSHSAIARLILPLYDRYAHDQALAQKNVFYEQVYGEKFWTRSFEEAHLWEGNFSAVESATQEPFLRARALVGDTPIYLFSADDRLSEAEQRIARSVNMTYIGGVPDFLELEEARGYSTQVVNDRHWNAHGNKLVGEFLIDYFSKDGILGQPETTR